jgi:hypothetical protein
MLPRRIRQPFDSPLRGLRRGSRFRSRVTPDRFGPWRPSRGATMPSADASPLHPPVTRRAAPRLRGAWDGGLPSYERDRPLHHLRLDPRACTWGFGVWCHLTRPVGLIGGSSSSAHSVALRLPRRGRAPSRSCLRLVLAVFFPGESGGSCTGDFNPMSSRPCWAYTTHCSRRGNNGASWLGGPVSGWE